MTFQEEFLKCLRWRPAQAIEALYWHMTRRRVRARNCLRREIHLAPHAYEAWIDLIEKPFDSQILAQTATLSPANCPSIAIAIMPQSEATVEAVANSIASVMEQHVNDWELLVPPDCPGALPDDIRIRRMASADGMSPLALAVTQARSDYLLLLNAGDRLVQTALSHYCYSIGEHPNAAVYYADSDLIDETGCRRRPWFKPQWNSEMFLSQDYLTDSCLIDVTLARSACALDSGWPASTPYSLMLAITSVTSRPVLHIPHILCHAADQEKANDLDQRRLTVTRHLAPTRCEVSEGPFGTLRPRWPLPANPPLVSIIIPTRDKADLLKACISSLRDLTEYREYEVLVIDNQSSEPETLRYFEELGLDYRIRILTWNKPYNYAELNNFAVAQSHGTFICLLNNDTEIIEGAWLGEMMRYAMRPAIGAVGAMLLYGDRTIQHAGVVMGLGEAAGHAHRHQPSDTLGYFARAHIPHFVSAVTAACLVVAREKFDAVGGLDAEGFSVAYNDVDFCLKLERAGWRNVYAPQAVLLHHESKSRGNDMTPAHIDRYMRELALLQQRWGTRTRVDPLHHPRLDRASETYTINLRT